jgi:hypothetical protein
MAGNSLNTEATLQCPHGGTVQIVSSNSSTKADDAFMATGTDTFTISGCPFQIPATPPIPSPCLTVQWLVTDIRVTVSGMPTLSQSSTGLCLAGTMLPQGPVIIANTQAKVSSQ